MHVSAGVAGKWSYETSVAYICSIGYNLTFDLPMLCLSDGSWNGTQPVCEQITCVPPIAANNGSYVPQNAAYTFMDTVEFSCSIGFDLNGPNSANCSATGQWSHSSPVCQIKDCGSLTDPTHGKVVHTDGTIFGQTAYYSCNKGYTLNGTESRTCNELGNWTFESPTCDVIRKIYLLALYSSNPSLFKHVIGLLQLSVSVLLN